MSIGAVGERQVGVLLDGYHLLTSANAVGMISAARTPCATRAAMFSRLWPSD